MKKFILALSAIVCLQGAPVHAAAAAVAPVPVQVVTANATDVLAGMMMQWRQSPTGKAFFGIKEEPTTWYGKVWENFKWFDKSIAEPISIAMRWMQYFQLMNNMIHAVQQPVRQQLTPEQIEMLKQRIAAQQGQQRRVGRIS